MKPASRGYTQIKTLIYAKKLKFLYSKSEQQIVVYEGIESYRNYWVESLKRVPENTIDYTVGAPPDKEWIRLLGNSYKEYHALRVKKKILIWWGLTSSANLLIYKYK